MKTILLILIRKYQKYISPFISPCCKFYPSCSEYMIQSLNEHGCFKGFIKGIIRILKCNPFSKGGFDPVI